MCLRLCSQHSFPQVKGRLAAMCSIAAVELAKRSVEWDGTSELWDMRYERGQPLALSVIYIRVCFRLFPHHTQELNLKKKAEGYLFF